jgi:hypothetical protein
LANDFFIRRRDEIADRGFEATLFQTIVRKAANLAGARLTNSDVDALSERGKATELFVVNGASPEQVETVTDLIAEGEARGLHERYKCRVRSPWWSVPLPKRGVPAAFLTYMSHAFPRLVANDAGALSTNTIHNVSLLDGVDPDALAVAFYNSLTLLSAELVGRSYGGGILKLEPTEAERLLIPPFQNDLAAHIGDVDRLLRAGDVGSALELVDRLVLLPLGLTEKQIAALREARRKLVSRRHNRSRKEHEPKTDPNGGA